MSEATRAYIYSVLAAIGGIVLLYGLLSPEEVSAWLALGAVALGSGGNVLARMNTTTKRHGD